MNRFFLLFAFLLVVGCAGPRPGPPPPAPDEAGVDARYEQAFAAIRVHPVVQTFAAEHLDPSEPLAIEVSAELVPLDYTLLAANVAQAQGLSASPQRLAVVHDSLATLTAADRFSPVTDDALPLLSLRQQRPLVLFFTRMNDGRLAAQLYPNPYRRRSFDAVRDDAPGLALLIVFEDGAVDRIYAEPFAP